MADAGPVLGSVALGAQEIRRRVAELARAIDGDYTGRAPLLVGVWKSAAIFLADLAREIRAPLQLDILAISSYTRESERGTGGVRVEADVCVPIEGRDVIIVEDVVDTGLTLQYVLRMLAARLPASLAVCTLLDRRHRRIVDVPIRYRGFEIGDEFLVGYGLDFRESFRHLPELRVLHVA